MKRILFKPTYTREDGLVVTNFETIPLPRDFQAKVRSYVYFPSGAKGGNHKHPRTEIFLTYDDLELVWQNDSGQTHKTSMKPVKGKLKLFIIPPHLPHAVVNKSNKGALLIEFADGQQRGIEVVELV